MSALLILVAVLAAASPAVGQSAIRVVVNGSPVSLAAPAVMQAGQVMIPATRAFEAFGAAAVWLPAERTVLITNRTGRTVQMRIGEAVALVDGQARPLPVAPALVGGHPFVPAQFAFTALGAWVRFDEAERTLHVASQIMAIAIRRGGGAIRVVLDATGPLQPQMRTLQEPDRLVVDLHGGAFRPPDQDLLVGEAGVVRVRAAQFQIKPYITRVVFDLREQVVARTVAAADSFEFAIEVRPRGQAPAVQVPVPPPAAAPPPATVPVPPPAAAPPPAPASAPVALPEQPEPLVLLPPEPLPDDGIPRVLQVRVEQAAGRFRVFIEGTMPLEYAVREFLEPDRLVIDISGAVFVPVKQEIPVAGPVVTEVRAAQFQVDPNVTRVVVELRRKTAYTVTSGAADGSVLVVEILEPALRAHVVAIDAGHGGRDPGAIGPTGLYEKEVVLDIAQRVRELLVRGGVRVIMTRETDTFVELADRSRLARAQGATAFVSIHANASTRPAANGSETYYLTPQSLVLAQMMQEELGRVSGLVNRGVRTANFQVLRENDVPAVLVEVAYLSNVDEEARLRAAAFRQRLAEAVARAVHRFLLIYPVPAT
ncbi:MAG: N-acetylmuramoyl-L-alanine amidase family protein [bacterium]|nr:N-acetylmuramoyl-L-alanine amidase family protein [bacterium]